MKGKKILLTLLAIISLIVSPSIFSSCDKTSNEPTENPTVEPTLEPTALPIPTEPTDDLSFYLSDDNSYYTVGTYRGKS